MLLSRFWYVIVSLVAGAVTVLLFLAQSQYNRAGERTMTEALNADSQVVSWYMKDDARQRAAQLIQFALDPEIGKQLQEASSKDEKIPDQVRDKLRSALAKVLQGIDPAYSFDAVFAVDQNGRVVAHLGYEQVSAKQDFELGGYPVVADALHGYIRDDTLVLDRIYRVVGRPVEVEAGQPPAGAIIGARIIDDKFARELSERTGGAVAFFEGGKRVASGAPPEFDKSLFDQVDARLKEIEADQTYQEVGRSTVKHINKDVSVQYTRLPGEAYELGAGFAVGRRPYRVTTPWEFYSKADKQDFQMDKLGIILGIAAAAALLGIIFTFLEHSRPLSVFRREVQKLAKKEKDSLQPSLFSGVYRKIASDLNDSIDYLVSKGGGMTRGPADLEQVLGELPAQPQMSAFAMPGAEPTFNLSQSAPASAPKGAPVASARTGAASLPKPPAAKGGAPKPPTRGGDASKPDAAEAAPTPMAPPSGPKPSSPSEPGSGPIGPITADGDLMAEWRSVFEEFVKTKTECGENIENFTFDKFKVTLQKNQDALVKRHGATRVKFSVYVKDGKAALKASPLKE